MFVEKGSVEMNKSILYGHGVDSQTIHRRFTGVCNTASGAHLALSVIIPAGEGGWKGQINLFAKLTSNKEHGIFSWQFALHLGTMEKETEAFSPENPELLFSL